MSQYNKQMLIDILRDEFNITCQHDLEEAMKTMKKIDISQFTKNLENEGKSLALR